MPRRAPVREGPIYKNRSIAALVAAYNEAAHLGTVISTMPALVDRIVVVDDASTDSTPQVVGEAGDPRVTYIRHETNQGAGASKIAAHLAGADSGADILVTMDGDGQMDPEYLPALLDPIIDEGYDFAKGNRFFATDSWEGMPRHRIFGNVVLTFMTKAATGYWNLFDPQNGYTAMTRETSSRIAWDSLARDYSFENDMLAHLGLLRARIKDVDIPALYGNEVSHIRLTKAVPSIFATLHRALWRRFWLQYVVRSFSPVALFVVIGWVLLLWSLITGAYFISTAFGHIATGPVMVVVIPFIVGVQLEIAALVLDIINAPS
jgi:glycosyltransferase involved in cell wall biosynthesis